ncbi:hypothetical protein K2Y11_11350 [bacterium]|nr:hypothetical protein [bacterium]
MLGGLVWLTLGLGSLLNEASDRETLRLSTGVVFRELVITDGKLSTDRIGMEKENRALVVRDRREFEILFVDGSHTTAEDYQIKSIDRRDEPEQSITVHLEPKEKEGGKVRVIYEGRPGETYLRKRIEVEGTKVVDRLSVETWRVETIADVGGFGQPLFLDGNWFVGLEYPAGTTERIGHRLDAYHFPGRSTFQSKTAVVGARTPSLTVEQSFQRYLSTIRQPVRSHLLFATWFDRRAGDLSPENCISAFKQLKKGLLDPFNIKLNSFLVDDGYQNPDSLWQPGTHWPGGFNPLRDELELGGSHLGLWLPLNGRGLNSSWGAQKGWRVATHRKPFYWLPDPNYQSALRDVLTKYVRDTRINCFKHDFNFFDASSDDPSRPSNPRHHREAIVDATLELLSFERELNKDLFLSVTSGLWPSPWWLMHADAIWMGHGDYDHDWSFPQLTDREAEMTYRDDKIYRRVRLEKAQFPISSLMTHGIMRGRLDHTAPDETIEDWSDYVMMFFGRGTQLQELYLSPDLVPDPFWSVLGSAIRWAKAHEKTLQHTVFIGGSPTHADPYGYAHWSEEMGIVVLRNPSLVPVRFAVDWSSRPGDFADPSEWNPFVVYPHQERLAPIHSKQSFELNLPGRSVTIVHLYSKVPLGLESVPVGRFELMRKNGVFLLAMLDRPKDGGTQISTEPVDERDEWRNRLVTTSLRGGDLWIESYPAHGVAIEIQGATESRHRHAGRHEERLWEVKEYKWAGSVEPQEISLHLKLPPTPRWPEKCHVRSVVRTYFELDVIDQLDLPPNTSAPDWPQVLNSRRGLTEQVLLDGKTLARGRGLWERLGWLLLVAVLPIGFIQWFTSWAIRKVSWPIGLSIRCIVAMGVATLYLLTPLGTWLLQTLEG